MGVRPWERFEMPSGDHVQGRSGGMPDLGHPGQGWLVWPARQGVISARGVPQGPLSQRARGLTSICLPQAQPPGRPPPSGNRIMAAFAEGVTASYSFEGQPASAQCAVPGDGFRSVLGATGCEAAMVAEKRAEQ